jgi:hypothetical protein
MDTDLTPIDKGRVPAVVTKALTVRFDYTTVGKEEKGKLIYLAGEIKKANSSHLRFGIAVGEAVAKAHALLACDGKDGQFSAWVEAECGFGRTTAYKYMQVWDAFNDCEVIDQFDLSALQTLSAPKAPEKARIEAVKLAKKGEHITNDRSKELCDQFREKPAPNPKNNGVVVHNVNNSTEPSASVSGTGNNPPSASPPSLPSEGTVNQTETGSQGDGDAGECPPGEHVWVEDSIGEACKVCRVSRVDVEPEAAAHVNEFLAMELEPAYDGFGDEVTGELRHVFQIVSEFKEKRQQLTNLKTWITQRLNHPGAAVLASGESRIKADIDNLDIELKFAVPYCECVYCKNKMPKLANCNACKGRGWITQEIYKQAPKELKRV